MSFLIEEITIFSFIGINSRDRDFFKNKIYNFCKKLFLNNKNNIYLTHDSIIIKYN